MSIFEKFQSWYRGLPDKKRYVELISATLTVPVLITVLLTNIGNLKGQENKTSASPSPSPTVTHSPALLSATPLPSSSTLPLTQADCIKKVGPVEITSPMEGAQVTSDPVTIDIAYTAGDYCSVVWSYRINNGSWSEFTDRALELYGLTSGEKQLELRVKSIVSSDTKILKRAFVVAKDEEVTPSSPSATIE